MSCPTCDLVVNWQGRGVFRRCGDRPDRPAITQQEKDLGGSREHAVAPQGRGSETHCRAQAYEALTWRFPGGA